MKSFANTPAQGPDEAVTRAREALREGRSVSFVGGGTDLLQLMKDRIVNRPGLDLPDEIIDLKGLEGADRIEEVDGAVSVGGMVTLAELIASEIVRNRFPALAQAAATVGTPQIRNAGTLAGNVVQRPWCWYYRNGFPCYKAGGDACFSAAGENQLHAIFGGGPSFIVHPSDTAPALVAHEARFRIVGPSGERVVPAEEFFVLPGEDPEHENVLADDEILVDVELPMPGGGSRSSYEKAMDREVWTHALSSVAVVLEMDGRECRSARIVLGGVAPIPWRVPEAERLLVGESVDRELAARVGEAAVAGARPLSKNGYKVPLTRTLVERTVARVAGV